MEQIRWSPWLALIAWIFKVRLCLSLGKKDKAIKLEAHIYQQKTYYPANETPERELGYEINQESCEEYG
ncbi:hypothetical protein SAMN05661003_12124 [Desulfuromonas thiophila]|uniref:Uncharacterized protein n=1 Tax=Desulfuromonas thiophila TaxID=57664 RepID=A0A1G7EL77_9BACT|nr:hypothetical protein SAMN05661003_12124 [Desulfuromonas thiophila]